MSDFKQFSRYQKMLFPTLIGSAHMNRLSPALLVQRGGDARSRMWILWKSETPLAILAIGYQITCGLGGYEIIRLKKNGRDFIFKGKLRRIPSGHWRIIATAT